MIENASDLLNLPIRSTAERDRHAGATSPQVHRTFYDPTTYARVNGQPTISLDVTKRIGANIIANNQAVRDVVDEGAARAGRAGVHVTYLFDEFDRHPRPAELAVGFDHPGHRAGDDHRRGRAGPALRPAGRRVRSRPRS